MKSDQYAARLAGFMFLFLIATVISSSILLSGVEGNNAISDTFRNISESTLRVRLSVLMLIVSSISTFILAAMLYAVTKHQDKNLAILALSCRAAEAALYAIGIISVLTLLSLSEGTSSSGNELTSTHAIGNVVSNAWSMSTNIGATFFAVGSALYSYLFFKARSIPVLLSLVGLVASITLIVGVPLQTAAGHNTVDGASAAIWIPMFIFEISTGFWLLIKGAEIPEIRRTDRLVARA
jgi:Domain of unknown function (DUF4386)